MSGKDTESLRLGKEIYFSGKRVTELIGQQQWSNGSRHDCHRVSRLDHRLLVFAKKGHWVHEFTTPMKFVNIPACSWIAI